MQVHVKTPRIEFHIEGDLYPPLIELLKKDFGIDAIEIDEEDESVFIDEISLYQDITITPGEVMAIHRKNLKMTQRELGRRLGGKSRQYISDLERGRRKILPETAKILAAILGHHYKRYL